MASLTTKSIILSQKAFLSLITTGGKHCIATRGWFGLQGDFLWPWKDWIDRSFMQRFGDDLPEGSMSGAATNASQAWPGLSSDELALIHSRRMRCAGCGSKVIPDVMTDVTAYRCIAVRLLMLASLNERTSWAEIGEMLCRQHTRR